MAHSAGQTAMFAAIWMLLAVATVSGWPFSKRMQKRLSIEDSLLERLERFREQMPCGINGGPPLAPYQLDELHFDESVPGRIGANGTLSNVTVHDLDTFIVDYLTFSLFRMRLEYSITLPRIRSSGHYHTNVTIPDLFDLWGLGPFEFNLHNINVNGFMRLRMSIFGQLSIVEMDTQLSVDRVESRIENINGNKNESYFYNSLIEQLLPGILAENQRELSETIRTQLVPVINELLAGITLTDLVASEDASTVLCQID